MNIARPDTPGGGTHERGNARTSISWKPASKQDTGAVSRALSEAWRGKWLKITAQRRKLAAFRQSAQIPATGLLCDSVSSAFHGLQGGWLGVRLSLETAAGRRGEHPPSAGHFFGERGRSRFPDGGKRQLHEQKAPPLPIGPARSRRRCTGIGGPSR